jgi:hypothetical protein
MQSSSIWERDCGIKIKLLFMDNLITGYVQDEMGGPCSTNGEKRNA